MNARESYQVLWTIKILSVTAGLLVKTVFITKKNVCFSARYVDDAFCISIGTIRQLNVYLENSIIPSNQVYCRNEV